MNIVKLVTGLQNAANTTLTSLQLMTLGKVVEKLNVGAIESVASLSSISSTVSAGTLFYVQNEQEIYYYNGIFTLPLSGIGYSLGYGWGDNSGNYGRIGDNTTVNKSSPVPFSGSVVDWTQVSAGIFHSLGVTTSGVAYGWGRGNNGCIGDNTNINRSSPVTVVGGLNWTQVSAGQEHSLGLTSAGVAYAWGDNGSGRLGDGTTTARSSPVSVVGGLSPWSQVSAGGTFSHGVTSTGVAYGWGSNTSGRLGIGNAASTFSSPVSVVGSLTWSQVSDGQNYCLGRTTGGVAYGWGTNNFNQLGDGTASDRSSPTAVAGGFTNWSQVSAGKDSATTLHSLGLRSSGIAYGWGWNTNGQLGDGTAEARASPVTIVGGITNWTQVSAGSSHSLGRTTAGIVYAWGSNSNGGLGNNTTTNRSSPVRVIGGITNWSQIDAALTSLAIRTFT